MDVSEWKWQIELERKQKDEFFGSGHSQSPILPNKLSKFEGLDYYPPNPDCRFELELHEHPDKKTIKVTVTRGPEQTFIRWGEFRFAIGAKDYTLQAYRSAPREERLFIPFRDATSGKGSYGAGRYIDLESDKHRTTDEKWILDFNVAYNPWCAYSEAYSCPLVPLENWIKVPVRAGEKNYPLKKEKH